MPHRLATRALAPLLLAVLALVGGSAIAAGNFSDAKLEAFAVAAVEVQKLSAEWHQKIDGAEGEAQASQMRDQAGQELVAAIESTNGISLEEYNQIIEAARQDAELSARIRTFLDAQPAD